MEGTVKFFNRKKGFGFIHGEDEKDYFVHFTALPKGTFLRDGDKVSFEGVEGDRGLKAQNVQLLQKGSEIRGEGSGSSDGSNEESSAEPNEE